MNLPAHPVLLGGLLLLAAQAPSLHASVTEGIPLTDLPAASAEKPEDKKPEDKKPDEKKDDAKKDGEKKDEKPKPKPGQPKPYKEVITDEAQSDEGLFTVHRIDEKVFYEIPASALNREMLWVTEIAQTSAGTGFGGAPVGDRVVRWVRRNNKIYLRLVSFGLRGDGKTAIQRAVDAASFEPILMSFDVEAEGEEKEKEEKKTAVIDVTRLYTSDIAEFSAKDSLNAAGVDTGRSYVERIKSFPRNIEVRTVLTYNPKPGPYTPPPTTAMLHYSLALLPDKPMQGRYFDSRVGYFAEYFQDYASTENRVMDRRFVTRYRLEKKDPTAALSEPVQPIVYYISREVPEQWREYMKKGVEDWQVAFEAAGFKNAILCKVAPTEAEDPDWDPEDARYSVIRWAAMPISNAMGPHVHDPRSGEILSAHIIMWHDILKLAEEWYFVQCSPLDARARRLPLPESLTGELLRYVVAHEVGHTLGLRHNHKASSSYTVAQLRDKAFTEKYGNEASIMDYGRFNYVAQPGDDAHLIPKIGPYDRFAIEWGYVPLPNANSPEKEKPALDLIAARQFNDPTLRFGGEDGPAQSDPTVQTEDLGSDPIAATELGLKNLERVSGLLLPAATKFGEDYDRLGEIYDRFLGQRMTELLHVTKLVGGVAEVRNHAGRGAETFRPVSKQRQSQAVQFLLTHAFQTPRWVVPEGIIRRIEPSGVTNRVLNGQSYLLSSLLSENRIRRLMDSEALSPDTAYPVNGLVNDLQLGIWQELSQPQPVVSLYRRDLQRVYLRLMKSRLSGDGSAQSEMRPVARGAMKRLHSAIAAALPKTLDPMTRLHLQSAQKEIERTLNPVLPTEPGEGVSFAAPEYLNVSPQFSGCYLTQDSTGMAR